VVSEGRDVYIKWLADAPNIDVQGSRTALKFSRTIGDSLIQIFPYALSIGIFPYLADLAHEKNKQKLTDTLISALRICIWTFGPITAILIAVRFPLLRAVWESGKFSSTDTVVISRPFIFYALGMIGFSCEMMLNQTFYAMTNVWVPTAIGILTTGLNMILAGFGVNHAYGLAAIAGAESLSKSVKCVILWLLLRRHLGDVRAKENLLFFAKVLVGAVLAALCSWFLASQIAPSGDVLSKGDKIKLLLSVLVSGCAGMGFFLLWSRLTGIEEIQTLGSLARKVKSRFARG
jgi:putative peptidoglycan lipid II flippase